MRERSSYSSHVVYYPVDADNDAAVDIRLTVPSGYTGLTGGKHIERALIFFLSHIINIKLNNPFIVCSATFIA